MKKLYNLEAGSSGLLDLLFLRSSDRYSVTVSSLSSWRSTYLVSPENNIHSHYVNVSVLIKFLQKTSVFTLIIISSP